MLVTNGSIMIQSIGHNGNRQQAQRYDQVGSYHNWTGFRIRLADEITVYIQKANDAIDNHHPTLEPMLEASRRTKVKINYCFPPLTSLKSAMNFNTRLRGSYWLAL